MNFVALKKLPVIIFCENNQYSVFTHISKRRPRKTKINKIVNYQNQKLERGFNSSSLVNSNGTITSCSIVQLSVSR